MKLFRKSKLPLDKAEEIIEIILLALFFLILGVLAFLFNGTAKPL